MATEVKLLIETCTRCGGDVVGDNLGDGRPWQHVDRPDDHHVRFGTPAPEGYMDRQAPPATLDDLEDVLGDDMPPPGTPRRPDDEELPTAARRMIKTALEHGFETTARICTGPIPMARHHDPRGWRLVDSLLVGFRHADGRIAIAVWERQETEDSFKYQWALLAPEGAGLTMSADLRSYLKSPRPTH